MLAHSLLSTHFPSHPGDSFSLLGWHTSLGRAPLCSRSLLNCLLERAEKKKWGKRERERGKRRDIQKGHFSSGLSSFSKEGNKASPNTVYKRQEFPLLVASSLARDKLERDLSTALAFFPLKKAFFFFYVTDPVKFRKTYIAKLMNQSPLWDTAKLKARHYCKLVKTGMTQESWKVWGEKQACFHQL